MHRSLPAQQTSLGRRSGPHVHRASKTKPTPAPGGEGSAARLTQGNGHCAQPSLRLGSRRVPLLQPCAPSSARQPWIRIPGALHLGCRRRCLSGALQDPPVGVSPLPEILCHFPTGHFPSGPPSTSPGLSSHQSTPTRNQTHAHHIGKWILNHWIPREVLKYFFPVVCLSSLSAFVEGKSFCLNCFMMSPMHLQYIFSEHLLDQ